MVRVTVALTHDADVDRQSVLKADGFYLNGLSLLTYWGTALNFQRHTENHLQVSHEKKQGLENLIYGFISIKNINIYLKGTYPPFAIKKMQ